MSSYVPRHKPPKWWERVLTHPMENGIAILCAYSAMKLIIAVILAVTTPGNSGLMDMPPWLLLIVGSVLAFGALCAMLGLHWKLLHDVGRGWAMERLGWSMVIAGFMSYTVIVLTFFPNGIANIPEYMLICAMSSARVIALLLVERRVRKVQTKLGGQGS